MEFVTALTTVPNMDVFYKLSLAVLFGAVLGLERIFAHRSAGVRTYALVSMGSALFVIVAEIIADQYLAAGVAADPLRMAANVVVGVGFLGAGMIVFRESTVIGLTTAAGLWVAAAIGVAVGFGLYVPAFLATVFTLFVFTLLYWVEHGLLSIKDGAANSDR